MTATFRALSASVLAMAALGISSSASAQSTQAPPSSLAASIGGATSKSGNSFVGIAVGQSHYGTSCGSVAGLTCSNNGTSYSLTAGNMFTQNVGIELSYLDLGKANRAGGTVSARGLNLSAVGKLPLNDSFAVEGKVGTTYGITHVNVPVISGLSSGRDSGFGLGYGVALDVNITHGLQGAIGWEQHDMHFAGQGKSTVSDVTIALGYQF